MDMKRILSIMGNVIFIIGLLGGIVLMATKVKTGVYGEEFSIANISLGVGVIVSSFFGLILCEWLSQMLDNSEKQTSLLTESSKEQTSLLKEQLYLLNHIKNKLDKE